MEVCRRRDFKARFDWEFNGPKNRALPNCSQFGQGVRRPFSRGGVNPGPFSGGKESLPKQGGVFQRCRSPPRGERLQGSRKAPKGGPGTHCSGGTGIRGGPIGCDPGGRNFAPSVCPQLGQDLGGLKPPGAGVPGEDTISPLSSRGGGIFNPPRYFGSLLYSRGGGPESQKSRGGETPHRGGEERQFSGEGDTHQKGGGRWRTTTRRYRGTKDTEGGGPK